MILRTLNIYAMLCSIYLLQIFGALGLEWLLLLSRRALNFCPSLEDCFRNLALQLPNEKL